MARLFFRISVVSSLGRERVHELAVSATTPCDYRHIDRLLTPLVGYHQSMSNYNVEQEREDEAQKHLDINIVIDYTSFPRTARRRTHIARGRESSRSNSRSRGKHTT